MKKRLFAAAGGVLAAALVFLSPGVSQAQHRGGHVGHAGHVGSGHVSHVNHVGHVGASHVGSWHGGHVGTVNRAHVGTWNRAHAGVYPSSAYRPYVYGSRYAYNTRPYYYGNRYASYRPYYYNNRYSGGGLFGLGYLLGNVLGNGGYGYGYPSYYTSNSYYSYPTYNSGYYDYSYAPPVTSYQSSYPVDPVPNQPAVTGAPVEVMVPATAEVWFDGYLTTQQGTVRVFQTPALQPGQTYSYQVRARWMENGQVHDVTRTLQVREGVPSFLDFTR